MPASDECHTSNHQVENRSHLSVRHNSFLEVRLRILIQHTNTPYFIYWKFRCIVKIEEMFPLRRPHWFSRPHHTAGNLRTSTKRLNNSEDFGSLPFWGNKTIPRTKCISKIRAKFALLAVLVKLNLNRSGFPLRRAKQSWDRNTKSDEGTSFVTADLGFVRIRQILFDWNWCVLII